MISPHRLFLICQSFIFRWLRLLLRLIYLFLELLSYWTLMDIFGLFEFLLLLWLLKGHFNLAMLSFFNLIGHIFRCLDLVVAKFIVWGVQLYLTGHRQKRTLHVNYVIVWLKTLLWFIWSLIFVINTKLTHLFLLF